MAQLQQPSTNGFEIEALAPIGTYVATCLDIEDQFAVDRPKFENPQETEKLDVTRFLFGFRGADGHLYKVQSFEFRISGSPKSNLFKFLTAWLGKPPQYGWDYCELKGEGTMITIAHKQSRDGTKTYANLIGIAPVIDQLKAQIIPLAAFGVVPATQITPPAGGTPQAAYNQPPGTQASVPAQASESANQQPTPPTPPAWNPHTTEDEDVPF